jgi:uncharacterized protein
VRNPFDNRTTFGGPMPLLTQIFIAFGVMMVGYAVFQMIGIWLAMATTGLSMSSFMHPDYAKADEKFIAAFKIIQVFADIGLFVFPALVLPYLFFQQNPVLFMGMDKKSPLLLVVIAIAMAVCVQPAVDLVAKLNQLLDLPQLFGRMDLSDKTEQVMQKVLYMPRTIDLVVNILFVAVLPAIAEELFFRGFLQKALEKWLKNGHWAVIIAALIFSFIHFEFTGFLPRWLLGLLMGYAYLWSRDIKLPILIHFTNNFMDLMQSYYLQQQGTGLKPQTTETGPPLYIYIVSLLLMAVLLYLFHLKAKSEEIIYDEDNQDV